MDDHSDDFRRPKSSRIEVYAGSGRRRWDEALKARIVVESLAPGAVVTEVARRHGFRPQQVHDWRRLARQGLLDAPGVVREAPPAPFVPLITDSMPPASPREKSAISIEIEGAVVHLRGVGPGSSIGVLTEVFAALRKSRSC
jgi:transposase